MPAGSGSVARRVGASARRKDRAHRRERWATSRIPSQRLAAHYGVSAGRARHFRSDDPSGPLTSLLAIIADPDVPPDEASKLVVAVLETWESRYVEAPPEELEARLCHLREVEEHRLQAEQDRALMVRCEKRTDACRQHASALIEIALIDELLTGGPDV